MPAGLVYPHYSPSYKQGFARSAAESANPERWQQLLSAHVPALGISWPATTGEMFTLRDISGHGDDFSDATSNISWDATPHGYCVNPTWAMIGNVTDVGNVDDFTVFCWIRWGATGAWQSQMRFDRSSGSGYLQIRSTAQGTPGVNMYDTADSQVASISSGLSLSTGDIRCFGMRIHSGTLDVFGDVVGSKLGSDSSLGNGLGSQDAIELDAGRSQFLGLFRYDIGLCDTAIGDIIRDPLALFRLRPRVISIPAAAGTVDLAADISTAANVTADTTVDRAVASGITVSGLVVAGASVNRDLDAAVSGSCLVVGDIAVDRQLSADVTSSCLVVGDISISGQVNVAADVTASCVVVAALSVDRTLAAAVSGTVLATADLHVVTQLAADVVTSGSVGGDFVVDRQLAAGIVSSGSCSGSLTRSVALAADVLANVSVEAALAIVGEAVARSVTITISRPWNVAVTVSRPGNCSITVT